MTSASGNVTINLDGRDIEAKPGELVIAAAERNGVYIPRFCYHPRMTPVGMCRMCLVNVEGPRGTSLQVSCMLTAAEGMKIDTQAPEVKKAQDGVLEFLLVNHPLDCPVCDKGGECPLQDQTLTFGPGETRFVEEKRHFEKPINISPLVALDRERCILCDRCTRFSKEVAGDPLIHFQNRGNETEVNVFPEHPFSSYFSGNTVQICPVGALTATPYRFKARPWDLEQVESTCTSCAFGCRVAVQSSGDKLTRYLGIDADPTNHGWMCDKGRFDFEAINSEARISTPRVKKEGEHVEVSWSEALSAAALALRGTPAERVGFIGGSRLANEDQYAWVKLAKAVIGTDNVDAQLGDGLPAETVLGVSRATIDETCAARAVVLLAPDLKEELPVLYLRLREAVQQRGLAVIEIAAHETSFTRYARHHLCYRAGDGAAIALALLGRSTGEAGGVSADELAAARSTLTAAGDVVVVFGRQSVADSGQGISDAVGLFAQHSNARFLPVLRRSNVFGALDMGLAPGMLPGRVTLDEGRRWFSEAWGSTPKRRGLDATGMLRAATAGELDVLVLLGADPLADFPDRELARDALANVGTVISVDILPNGSTASADVVLPAAAYAERSGTTTNIEGRITRMGQKITAPGVAWPDWTIAAELAVQLGADLGLESLGGIWAEIEAVSPLHVGITASALAAGQNRDGIVAPVGEGVTAGEVSPEVATDVGSGSSASVPSSIDPESWPGIGEAEWQGFPNDAIAMTPTDPDSSFHVVQRPSGVAPKPLRYQLEDASPPPVDGYAVRLVAGRKLYDLGTLVQHSPHLAGLIAEETLRVHPTMLATLGIETGGDVRLRNAKGDMVMPVIADERVARGVAVLPFGLSEAGAAMFIDATQSITNIRLETP